MPRRQHLSATSAPFRCEWRPSRWLTGALLGLSSLAAVALLNCDLELHLAWPLAIAALLLGARQARAEARKPLRQLLLPSPPAPMCVDGVSVHGPVLLERGPLLLLRWHQGRRRHQLLFWPDTLPRARRRELRLAVRAYGVSRRPASVAP